MGPISEQNSGNQPTQPSEKGAQGEEEPEAPGERAAAETTSTQNREIVHGASLRDTYLRIRIRGTQESVDSRQSDSRGKLGRNRREQGQLRQPQQAAVPSPATATPAEHPSSSFAGAVPLVGGAGRQYIEEVMLPGHEQQMVMPGAGLGRRYVRRRLPSQSETSAFLPRGDQVFEATEGSLQPQSQIGRGYERVRRVLLGRRLTTAEQVHERLTKVKALAVLSSDAISSVAYATEASLAILIGAGTAALTQNLPITACIVALMIIVGVSYRQTIHAYPNGGGSYIVARDNLGVLPGLIAAAALLIDYVLTVSVSVSSGVDAMVSALPALNNFSVELGVVFIAVIMVVNLRGIRESGTIFAAPTYLFIGAFAIMILTGIFHAIFSPGGPFGAIAPHQSPAALGWAPQHMGPLLLLTAFASGCVAMTGTEAISNAVPVFKPPESKNAARTLVAMVTILAIFYLGTTYLAWRFGIVPHPNQNPTLDSQIAALLFVGPFAWVYYVVQFATLLILVLAANTSFADFPRLSSILARDGFLPHQFAFRGDRLAFSTGIIILAALSSILLIVFHGSTEALINLYALGVFTAFTLSQSGMVVHWYRLRARAGVNWRRSLGINLVGAVATAIVAAIITITKFDRGAWIVVLLVPLLVLLFRGISKHYSFVQRHTKALTPLHAQDLRHVLVVPIAELNRPACQALAYARSLIQPVVAVHTAMDKADETAFRNEWDQWAAEQQATLERAVEAARMAAETPEGRAEYARMRALVQERPQMVVLQSPYRALVPPLVRYIEMLRDVNPQRTVSVLLPEFVPAHWWESLLHNQTALRLKLALYSDAGVVVFNIPYHLPQ
jgi:amino acid transporter